jgi:prepilin-type N-terminal cleavage/methylation domain-containing protein/prepilin-type processing-associated H-X9-DG protein
MSRRTAGFSLVELMVVCAVLAILIAILLPVLGSARVASKRVSCRGQLSDIGRLFQMYLNDSRNKLPHVNPVPTLSMIPGIPAPELLAKYSKDVRAGWKCPADRITRKIEGTPEGFETYFDREGISYLYNPMLAQLYAGQQLNDHPQYRQKKINQLAIFWEFEAFHGRENTLGSMNYLFADWHVGDLGNE